MKRSILFSTVAVAAFATGYFGSPSLVSSSSLLTRVAAEEGDPCELPGSLMSGYMVSSGINGGLVCMAGGQS